MYRENDEEVYVPEKRYMTENQFFENREDIASYCLKNNEPVVIQTNQGDLVVTSKYDYEFIREELRTTRRYLEAMEEYDNGEFVTLEELKKELDKK